MHFLLVLILCEHHSINVFTGNIKIEGRHIECIIIIQ